MKGSVPSGEKGTDQAVDVSTMATEAKDDSETTAKEQSADKTDAVP